MPLDHLGTRLHRADFLDEEGGSNPPVSHHADAVCRVSGRAGFRGRGRQNSGPELEGAARGLATQCCIFRIRFMTPPVSELMGCGLPHENHSNQGQAECQNPRPAGKRGGALIGAAQISARGRESQPRTGLTRLRAFRLSQIRRVHQERDGLEIEIGANQPLSPACSPSQPVPVLVVCGLYIYATPDVRSSGRRVQGMHRPDFSPRVHLVRRPIGSIHRVNPRSLPHGRHPGLVGCRRRLVDPDRGSAVGLLDPQGHLMQR